MNRSLQILAVYGTRPEVIKLAPVIAQLRGTSGVGVTVLATGQHRDLAPVAEQAFGLSANDCLDIMHAGQTPWELHSELLDRVTPHIADALPDLVLVQGDTTTTLAAAQAAFYCKVPVGHVEAGVRSHVLLAPFPEEMNRRLVTSLATLHFAPTAETARNLARAGVPSENTFITGNTVLDALGRVAGTVDGDNVRERLGVPAEGRLMLATVHRRESWGERMAGIGAAFCDILDTHPEDHLALPLHPNPSVHDVLKEALEDHPRAHLLDALPYTDFIGLLKCCHLVLTDSGGLQEEAPYFDKPVVVLRHETDRPEAVESGNAVLATTDPARIVVEASKLLDSAGTYRRMAESPNPFGDGHAAERIARAILSHFGRGKPPEPF